MSIITQIPLAGNAYLTKQGLNSTEIITENGLENWTQPETICSIYFHLSVPGEFILALRFKVINGESNIQIKIGENQIKQIVITGSGNDQIVTVGKFYSTIVGYVKIDLQGILRTGITYAEISSILIFGNSGTIYYVFDDFYFGRRGPSVHINYGSKSEQLPIEYFYNEITVPDGQDIIGAYYSAIAFSDGYFGIQVNGTEERRILFSIWSAYDTDDPEQIPEEYKVVLIKKGSDVVVQDFGNEGSGKQSFLRYNWKPNVTFKFLVYGIPIDNDNSLFTAWFQDPTDKIWNLIASFRKPKKSTNIKSVYSFSENFIPEMGWIQRKVIFSNPWTRDTKGSWHEITTCTFTGDATSKKSRLDFACGVENGEFYLKNCGFLNDIVKTEQILVRDPKNKIPDVNIAELP